MPADTPATPPPDPPRASTHFKVVSHSNMFYWWPVWVVGFVLAAISYADHTRLAIVPERTTIKPTTTERAGTFELTFPGQSTESLTDATVAPSDQDAFPYHIARGKHLGFIYAGVVLVVILATNVTLRGLWAVVNLLVIALVIVLLVLLHWWTSVVEELGRVHIFVNATGYLIPSVALFVIWTLTVFVYDQRRFIIFSPGQLIVKREIGDQKQIIDTTGVTVQKRLNDFVRHRLLGLGTAGDLVVSTSDGRFTFELPNVLFADRKVRQIAEVMKTRPITTA